MNKKHKNYLEPIGLLLLLVAFGWQCWEEHANQMKYEAYIYDLNQKVDAIWSGVYDEALRSERYHGTASVAVNYDSARWHQDFAGAWIQREQYGLSSEYGWDVCHLVPANYGGRCSST